MSKIKEKKWKLTKEEALEALSDGHSFYLISYAQAVCKTMGVEFPESLILRYKNQKEANPTNDPKGLWLNNPDEPCEGVNSYKLSRYVTSRLGASEFTGDYFGRGTQARSNVEAIRKVLHI